MNRVDAAPIASMAATDDGYGFRSQHPGPIRRRSNLWMHLTEPSAHVEEEVVALVPVAERIRSSGKPETAEPTRLGENTNGERRRQLLVLNWALQSALSCEPGQQI
jgi:hypothetical protein